MNVQGVLHTIDGISTWVGKAFAWLMVVLMIVVCVEVFDEVAAKKAGENPLFKKIVQSQLAFAKRAVQWEQDTVVNRKMAFDHYFGPNAKKPI